MPALPNWRSGLYLSCAALTAGAAMREGEATGSLGDRLDFQTILNEFDADHDGWAERLIHSDHGDATTIALYLYSDMGLAPLKTPLRRDSVSPESCVDPQIGRGIFIELKSQPRNPTLSQSAREGRSPSN
jgi:hypothetical protein